MDSTVVTQADFEALQLQRGRVPRGVRAIPARCLNGWPTVVETEPRLADGTPFPTFWYLICKQLSAAISTLESEGVMKALEAELREDPELAAQYLAAHKQYLAARDAVAEVPEIADFSAGGMPERVKCLHALVGHSLAAGPGVNPIGDKALVLLTEAGRHPHAGPCVEVERG